MFTDPIHFSFFALKVYSRNSTMAVFVLWRRPPSDADCGASICRRRTGKTHSCCVQSTEPDCHLGLLRQIKEGDWLTHVDMS